MCTCLSTAAWAGGWARPLGGGYAQAGGGLGLHADAMYYPEHVNDGRRLGVGLGLAAVYER